MLKVPASDRDMIYFYNKHRSYNYNNKRMFYTSASCLTPDNSKSDNDNNSDNDDNSDDSSISSTPALDVYEQFKNKPIQEVPLRRTI